MTPEREAALREFRQIVGDDLRRCIPQPTELESRAIDATADLTSVLVCAKHHLHRAGALAEYIADSNYVFRGLNCLGLERLRDTFAANYFLESVFLTNRALAISEPAGSA